MKNRCQQNRRDHFQFMYICTMRICIVCINVYARKYLCIGIFIDAIPCTKRCVEIFHHIEITGKDTFGPKVIFDVRSRYCKMSVVRLWECVRWLTCRLSLDCPSDMSHQASHENCNRYLPQMVLLCLYRRRHHIWLSNFLQLSWAFFFLLMLQVQGDVTDTHRLSME